MNSVEHRLAVVIGGGNGIGAACCRLMAARDWKVAVLDFDQAGAQKIAAEIGGKAFACDVRDLAGLEKLATEIETAMGPVTSLVVSSGAFQERMDPADVPPEMFRHIFEVNVEGTFYANRVFGTLMARRGKGSIVNIASSAAHGSQPLFIYGPSKSAVYSLSRCLAGQWGRSGVRVNSVSPGPTIVPRQAARKPGRYAANMEDHLAIGRRLQPPEVAEGVEFLASDKASGITGIDLLIDAGQIAASTWGLFGGVPPRQE